MPGRGLGWLPYEAWSLLSACGAALHQERMSLFSSQGRIAQQRRALSGRQDGGRAERDGVVAASVIDRPLAGKY